MFGTKIISWLQISQNYNQFHKTIYSLRWVYSNGSNLILKLLSPNISFPVDCEILPLDKSSSTPDCLETPIGWTYFVLQVPWPLSPYCFWLDNFFEAKGNQIRLEINNQMNNICWHGEELVVPCEMRNIYTSTLEERYHFVKMPPIHFQYWFFNSICFLDWAKIWDQIGLSFPKVWL